MSFSLHTWIEAYKLWHLVLLTTTHGENYHFVSYVGKIPMKKRYGTGNFRVGTPFALG